MPITIVGVGTNSGTGAVSVSIPAGYAANDILFLMCESASAEAVTAPSGYTEAPSSPQVASDTRLHIFWKRLSASESNPSVPDPGNHVAVRAVLVRGCVTTGSPVAASNGDTAAASTAITYPSVTAPGGGYGVLHAATHGADTSAVDFVSVSADELEQGTVQSWAYGSTQGDGGGVFLVSGLAAGGTAITTAAVQDAARAQARISLVLTPASSTEVVVPHVRLAAVVSTGTDAVVVPHVRLAFVVDTSPPPVVAAKRRWSAFVN